MLTFAIATITCGLLALLFAGLVVARMGRILETICQQSLERSRDDSINFERMASGRCVDAEKQAALVNRVTNAMVLFCEMSDLKIAIVKEQMELEQELQLARIRSGADPQPDSTNDFDEPFTDPNPIVPTGVAEHAP